MCYINPLVLSDRRVSNLRNQGRNTLFVLLGLYDFDRDEKKKKISTYYPLLMFIFHVFYRMESSHAMFRL